MTPAQFTRTSIREPSYCEPNPDDDQNVRLDMSPEIEVCCSEDERCEDSSVVRAEAREVGERDMSVQRYEVLAKSCAMLRPTPRLPPVMRACRMVGIF